MPTVAEIQKRKKKLQEQNPEEFARQMEAQQIADQAVPEQVTQADLDAALAQGIDVFKGRNLKIASRTEQIGQKQRNATEAAVTGEQQRQQTAGLVNLADKTLSEQERLRKLSGLPAGASMQEVMDKTRIERGVQEGLPLGIKTAAEIINGVTAVIAGKKTARVQVAEENLNTALNVINKNIDLVRTGAKPSYEAFHDFNLAKESINDLERTNKGLGKINLRYWLSGGKETEIAVLQAKTTLENLRLELLNAIAQGAVDKRALALGRQALGGMT